MIRIFKCHFCVLKFISLDNCILNVYVLTPWSHVADARVYLRHGSRGGAEVERLRRAGAVEYVAHHR